ncbi:DUF5954 family protein, partial [Kitasatospora sp. NPDC056789]
MVNFPDDVPGYLSIRMAAPTEPVAGMADVEAWTARDSYPQILSAGSRAFGVARELPTGGWALRTSMAEVYPQSARDDLG